MTKKWTFTILILLMPLSAGAQSDDFCIWYSLSAKAGITNRIDAEISGELRTYKNAGRTEQGFFELGATYKLKDFLSVGLSYRFIEAFEDDLKYHPQHKIFADLNGTFKFGRFTLQDRVRYQIMSKTYFEYADDKIPDQTIRFRLKLIYRTPSFPLNPYIFSETFIPVFNDPERLIGKSRLSAGAEYSISKMQSVKLGYIFQRDWLPSLSDDHIIQVGYNFSF